MYMLLHTQELGVPVLDFDKKQVIHFVPWEIDRGYQQWKRLNKAGPEVVMKGWTYTTAREVAYNAKHTR
jgi:hypothetical protein